VIEFRAAARILPKDLKNMSNSESRRIFAKTAGLTSALTFLNLNPLARGANEKVALALIGGHNQGRGVALRAIRQGAEIKTFCDLDEEVIGKVSPQLEGAQKKAPRAVKDFRNAPRMPGGKRRLR
jgi:hypothetical protein